MGFLVPKMKNMLKSNLIPYQDNFQLNITIEQAQFEKQITQGQKKIGGPTSIDERRTLVVIVLPSIFLN
jgi:hypothetical protein